MKHVRMFFVMMSALLAMCPPFVWSQVDASTHESDHLEDEQVEVLETVHVHGFKLNKDQQLGPVPKYTPWPAMPPALQGHEVDDWMKARILVSKTAETTLVVLVPAKNRFINLAGVQALQQWTFDPQMKGNDPVDGELTVRIHFRTHE
ncbi:MAG: energy transducer TonB [Nitrospira sp.]|nr:energy transducer TonB [Nitrospira sp.]